MPGERHYEDLAFLEASDGASVDGPYGCAGLGAEIDPA